MRLSGHFLYALLSLCLPHPTIPTAVDKEFFIITILPLHAHDIHITFVYSYLLLPLSLIALVRLLL